MNILELCNLIELQPEMKRRVLEIADSFDFGTVERQIQALRDYQKMEKAEKELESILGEDSDHIKILTYSLYAAACAHTIYREKGISDKIFVETMKCFTRFIGETHAMTGKWVYDRYWWTVRQVGCHLFRIGELEYEIQPLEDRTVISMHIPSDAHFSPDKVSESIEMSRVFLSTFYPEYADCEYYCHSWLLDPQLRDMLSPDSNILSFQNRFEISGEGDEGTDFVAWLFRSATNDYTELPEKTSLQRRVKKHILSGGVMRNVCGRLR